VFYQKCAVENFLVYYLLEEFFLKKSFLSLRLQKFLFNINALSVTKLQMAKPEGIPSEVVQSSPERIATAN
jgi:hypothetical protein